VRALNDSENFCPGSHAHRTHVAQAALHDFQLFMTDLSNEARYTVYLCAYANPGSGAILPAQKPGKTPEEFAKEISEYAKSAALFCHVDGGVAGRLTSAAVLDLGPKIIEGLHTAVAQQAGADSMDVMEEELKEGVKEEAPKVHATRLGMYDVMMREVCTWQPA
jgi:G patch domain-containing protein 1